MITLRNPATGEAFEVDNLRKALRLTNSTFGKLADNRLEIVTYAAVIRVRNAACQIIDERQVGQPSTDRLAVERVIETGEVGLHTWHSLSEHYRYDPATTITMEMKICKP